MLTYFHDIWMSLVLLLVLLSFQKLGEYADDCTKAIYTPHNNKIQVVVDMMMKIYMLFILNLALMTNKEHLS